MIYRAPRVDEIDSYENLAEHPLQSFAWGEFRETTGVITRRIVGFDNSEMVSQAQVTFHPLPSVPYTVGYYPKGKWPDEIQLKALAELGAREKALFIKLEPNISKPPYQESDIKGLRAFLEEHNCTPGRPLFTPYSFIMDLTKSEEELLALMKPKTRYNVRLAQKYGVTVAEDSSPQGFEEYLTLLKLTTKRQQFYAHGQDYQKNMWREMSEAGIGHIIKATYQGKVLAAWILFKYKDTLYYPYGASSREYPEVMASNLMMWEAIRIGKAWGCKKFDMWGALGPEAEKDDPWQGFHRFKEGYGGVLTEFVGSYDLVIDKQLYQIYRLVDRWRWRLLKLKSKIPFLP